MFGYNLLVFLNNGLNKLYLSLLKSLVFYELNGEERKLRFVSVFQYMNVQRLVVIRIKLKNKTEEYKNSWHSFFFAKIGNNFITYKSN